VNGLGSSVHPGTSLPALGAPQGKETQPLGCYRKEENEFAWQSRIMSESTARAGLTEDPQTAPLRTDCNGL